MGEDGGWWNRVVREDLVGSGVVAGGSVLLEIWLVLWGVVAEEKVGGEEGLRRSRIGVRW